MQVLRFATRAQIEAIFEENHGLWGVPLSSEDYREYWFSLFLTQWGSSNLRYMALTEEEDGPLLSSLKLYRFTGRLYGAPAVIAGIGAVYTPLAQRQAGSASLLISEVLDYMQRKRAALALLFSDIGLPFYERLGFVSLPVLESHGPLAEGDAARGRSPRGVTIREVQIRDAPALSTFHARLTSGSPLEIDRDPLYWEFVLFRRRQFWTLAPQGTGTPVSLLAERDGRAVAAGFAVVSEGELRLQELGVLPGEDESGRAILDTILDAGRRGGAKTWRGRLHPDVARLDPRLHGDKAPPSTAFPMAAPLGSTPSMEPLSADPALHFWALDQI